MPQAHLAARRTQCFFRTLIVITLPISFLGAGCDPANQVALMEETDSRASAGPDASLRPPVDMAMVTSDLAVTDPRDSALSDSGCQAAEEHCANSLDDDCDGITDECDEGTLCQDGQCIEAMGDRCENNFDCPDGLICSGTSCQELRPATCGNEPQCQGPSQCSTVDICGNQPGCYGSLGGVCNVQCDCTGTLICKDAENVCVHCLHDGQCTDGGECMPSGLCSHQRILEEDTLEALRLTLATALNTCASKAQGRSAIGCAHLELAPTLSRDGSIAPSLLFGPEGCDFISAMPSGNMNLEVLLGCNGNRPRLHWSDELIRQESPIACITYVPYAPGSEDLTEWRISIGPCGQLHQSVQTP
jgi:hypothetical protein